MLPINTKITALLACFLVAGCDSGSNTTSVTGGEPGSGSEMSGGGSGIGNGADGGAGAGAGAGGGGENSGGVGGSQVVTLSPLPNPPLTEAPSQNDEPIALNPLFHTFTNFAPVGEPSPRVPPVVKAEITSDQFNAGLPEAVITVPNDVDPSQNAAPFFERLQNVRVNAGELVEIRYVPRDPEGELPGMFPEELPEGASFDDNFDGTKTLRWQTFQADVGISDFIVVAVDPQNGAYRTSQTVFIAIDEPVNAGEIPNAPPSIRPVDNYTVRVGDPAAIFLDGLDRNGTKPTMELLNPPPSATLTPDDRDEGLYWLRVVPDTVGTMNLDIIIRDSVDPTLTTMEQITLFVQPASSFERAGITLRDAASGGNVLFGSALSPVFYLQADGGLYESFAVSEFAIMTPESSMKWSSINPAPGLYEFSDTDNLMHFAQQHDMAVRGHPLVWHRSLPSWVEQTAVNDREAHMREFITRVMNRYGDNVEYWDVINEPLNDANGDMRESIWFEAMGESYIDIAFHQAKQLDPSATLVLNEFDVGFAGSKFDGLLALVDRLLERDVPVDAIGFQMHVFSSFDQFDELSANMAAIAERGLDAHITELDVAIAAGDNTATQANVYAQVVERCQAQPKCTVLQTWGFTDRYSFRKLTQPLYLDADYGVKPAYSAMREALAQ